MKDQQVTERRKRTLTDDDIEAIMNAAQNKFLLNFGKGIWGFAWRGIVLIALALAAFGAANHGKQP